ncbi:hypothetical protein EV385_6088 [Krasilnikovia cinnamomea]|uniref:Peptidase C39-like protein n=1 Tax=Krasilnikovia cinnamomea TaxID=349313 RepID=A0A4Q7ZU96_9ACTN|nr:hypothetical protein [Krasilnikovia cinnamomea]RZU54149.1 hypothetical protein EV385_6088 [Krasilnikovia cinnamomea]
MTDEHHWTDALQPFLTDAPEPIPFEPDPAPFDPAHVQDGPHDDPAVPERPELDFGAVGLPDPGWVTDGRLVGDPTGDAEHWFEQSANGYCVPASIAQIVSEYTGVHNMDESAFVARANALGLFTVGPDGVPSMGVGGAQKLLEDAGVPAGIEAGIGIETLEDYLAQGRRVMLAVDSDEIWYGREDEATADHAVVLTGIDTARGVAVLSDPGTPDGNMLEVPLTVLADAWEDSGNTALVCDEPPGGRTPAQPDGAVPVGLPVADQAGKPVFGVADDATAALLAPKGQIESVVSWVVDRPYVLLPVVLAGGALIATRRR